MGRNKIKIEKISNERNRHATFSKRKNGLFKKAMELSILCDCEIALLIFNSNEKCFQYCSTNDLENLLKKYTEGEEPCQTFSNKDYWSSFSKKSDYDFDQDLKAEYDSDEDAEPYPKPSPPTRSSSSNQTVTRSSSALSNSSSSHSSSKSTAASHTSQSHTNTPVPAKTFTPRLSSSIPTSPRTADSPYAPDFRTRESPRMSSYSYPDQYYDHYPQSPSSYGPSYSSHYSPEHSYPATRSQSAGYYSHVDSRAPYYAEPVQHSRSPYSYPQKSPMYDQSPRSVAEHVPEHEHLQAQRREQQALSRIPNEEAGERGNEEERKHVHEAELKGEGEMKVEDSSLDPTQPKTETFVHQGYQYSRYQPIPLHPNTKQQSSQQYALHQRFLEQQHQQRQLERQRQQELQEQDEKRERQPDEGDDEKQPDSKDNNNNNNNNNNNTTTLFKPLNNNNKSFIRPSDINESDEKVTKRPKLSISIPSGSGFDDSFKPKSPGAFISISPISFRPHQEHLLKFDPHDGMKSPFDLNGLSPFGVNPEYPFPDEKADRGKGQSESKEKENGS